MADGSPIEWLDVPGYKPASWNPTRGCSRQGDGCARCYAMGQAHRFSGLGKPYEGLTTIRNGRVDWTGVARFVPEMLSVPLRWRQPRAVFVDSMSDLFHPGVTFEQIAAVFGVMAACPQHFFMVLTKQPQRAREFFAWCVKRGNDGLSLFPDDPIGWRIRQMCHVAARRAANAIVPQNHGGPWPLSNVWLLASIWDQPSADRYLPDLLACPAALHGVSAEPLLGPVDLSRYLDAGGACECSPDSKRSERCERKGSRGWIRCNVGLQRLRWVILGGESGNGARPFHVDYARGLIAQCKKVPRWFGREMRCPVFIKQLGARPLITHREWERSIGDTSKLLLLSPKWDPKSPPGFVTLAVAGKGGDLSVVPGDWPREFPEVQT
jgi:protein gp37